jgi:hypothetical protein
VATTMAGVLVLLVLGVVVIAVVAGGRGELVAPVEPATPPGPVASSTGVVNPTPTATGTRPVVLRQGSIMHPYTPVSAVYGAGSLWLAFAGPLNMATDSRPPGTMELVRVDVANFTVTARWALPSAPQGLVVTAHAVWVADNSGQPNEGGQDSSDQVQEFDLTGRLIHTYSLPAVDTVAAATGDSVWVDYSLSTLVATSYLTRLHDGVTDAPRLLAGNAVAASVGDHALAACADAVYVGTTHISLTANSVAADGVVVNRVVPGGPAQSATGLGVGPLVCGASKGIVAIEWRVGPSSTQRSAVVAQEYFVNGPDAGPSVTLPDRTSLLGSCASGIWFGHTDPATHTSEVWWADGAAHQRGTVTLGMTVDVGAANGCSLWTVSPDPHQSDRWLLSAIVTK